MRRTLVACFLGVFLSNAPAFADPITIQVVEKEVIANVSVAGLYRIDLKITFEDVIGLNENALNITATQINPTDLALLSRLKDASKISIPTQLPVMINVSPSPQSTLTFTGVVDIDLTTSNLSFQPSLRFMKAREGGTFEDVTIFSGVGSYRVRGTSGDFSDLLIAADLRSNTTVINDKFNLLQSTLNANASRIEPAMLQNLQSKLDAARANFNQGLNGQAAEVLDSMIIDIKTDAGDSIPNSYRANDPSTINVAGSLRAQAAQLIFSLRL